ncbi:MAG TPA: hypothetical protein VKB51_13005 [bacterium]|nr:hypothetical protein [bacterium]
MVPATARWTRVPRPGGWLQFESGWLSTDQALKNLETMVSLLQRTLEGLNGIDSLMEDGIATVSDAWTAADKRRPPAYEISETVWTRLKQIDEIVRQCRFHGRGLLDGQSGVVGIGVGVDFIRGGANTRSSPPEGYRVAIEALPSRAVILGGVPLEEDWVRAEEEIFLAEGEHFVRHRITPGETVAGLLKALREETRTAGMDVQIGLTAQRRLIVRHNQYGSQYKFKGCSFRTPLLSKRPGKVEWSRKGRDIQGTLAGEQAFGIGRMLVGYLDNEQTSELAVMWQGGRLDEGRHARCYVVQNGLRFQDGAGADNAPVCLALPVMDSRALGRWMETPSDYRSLADVRFDTWQELRDGLHLMLAVAFDVEDWRERVQGWIKRYQNQALACLRRSSPLRELPAADERVTAAQAERMALQLKELMQHELAVAR